MTVVRKVDGSIDVGCLPLVARMQQLTFIFERVQALRKDLGEYLVDVPSYTKPQSRQVVLKGDWVKETKEWLGARGF